MVRLQAAWEMSAGLGVCLACGLPRLACSSFRGPSQKGSWKAHCGGCSLPWPISGGAHLLFFNYHCQPLVDWISLVPRLSIISQVGKVRQGTWGLYWAGPSVDPRSLAALGPARPPRPVLFLTRPWPRNGVVVGRVGGVRARRGARRECVEILLNGGVG